MKNIIIAVFCVLILASFCSCGKNEEFVVAIDEELYGNLIEAGSNDFPLDSNTAVKAAKELMWNEYKLTERKNEDRVSEITSKSIPYGDVVMKYTISVIGKSGADGYPLYIALHGGGGSDTPDVNDSQWEIMSRYYKDSIKNGIYVAPRGVRDTWNTHFNPESYPLYERLISDISIYYGIDTNRVYLVGYSAGGDGVYQITPRLADRFAAANMSAGHPNGINLTNICHVPFQIQVGDGDSSYDRNREAARYGEVLENLNKEYGEGYLHNINIHRGKGHQVVDNDPAKTEQLVYANPVPWYYGEKAANAMRDTNAISFLEQYTRDPVPKRVVWDLSVRPEMTETASFYWLRAGTDLREGVIVASYDTEKNTVTIEQCTVKGEITVLLDERMVDLFKPVQVVVDGQTTEYTVTPSRDVMTETLLERNDPEYVFAAKIKLDMK